MPSVSRVRQKGPFYHPKTYLGTEYNWTFKVVGGQVVWYWKKGIDYYFPSQDNFLLKEQWYCADRTNPGPPYRTGGPLWLLHAEWPLITVKSGTWYNSAGTAKYVGKFVAYPPLLATWATGQGYFPQDNSLHGMGPTAWNRFRPTKPKVDLGVFLAELREFKSLFQVSFSNLKGVAGAYLNFKFGWSPLVRDICKTLESYKKLDRTLSYIRKNNGQWLKRRGTLSDAWDVLQQPIVDTSLTCIRPVLTNNYYKNNRLYPTNCSYSRTLKTNTWFEALWKYYIPDLHLDRADSIKTSRLLRHLYQLRLGLDTAWELLPYSWLADWFSNIGDNMSNITNNAFDNLVARYAYLMRHRLMMIDWSESISMFNGPALNVGNLTTHYECKERTTASPYGFSVDWPDFTASQLAILAALGIQRAT